MADVKPLKLVDQGGGFGRLEEFAAGDRVPSDAVPEKLQALADASWAANQVPYFTGSNTVDKFALSAVSRGILAAGLGNAANATAQVDVNDTTASRLLMVGAGGLLGNARARNSIAGAELTRPTEFFSINAGGVSPYAYLGVGLHINWAGGYGVQLFGGAVADRLSYRRQNANGTWNTPVEFWHTGNLTPNVLASYTLATLPNAAANPRLQAWCSNLTGGAMPVYSDGTNWRRVFDNSIAN